MSVASIPEASSASCVRVITRAQFVSRYLADNDLPAAYWSATRAEKTAILDRATAALKYHRKALIRLFRRMHRRALKLIRRGGRRPFYSAAARQVLAKLWELMDHPSERKLKGSVPVWVEAMRRFGELDIPDGVADELYQMSSATMGRIVRAQRPRRRQAARRSRPHSQVQADTPLRTWGDWDDVRPGEVQIDTVFHAGGGAPGGYLYTLTVIDPYSGWTHAEAIPSLGRQHVMPALDHLWRKCPFEWVSLHTDNGSEFLNRQCVRWCRLHRIRQTRGRPGKSDDQALVENANRVFVRRWAGDLRYEGASALEALNELYVVTADLANFFTGRTRLVEKKRHGRKVTRRYDDSMTPHERLVQSGALDAVKIKGLGMRLRKMNPAELRRERERLCDRLWDLARNTR